MSGQVRSCQVKSSQFGSGQVRLGRVASGLVGRGKAGSGQVSVSGLSRDFSTLYTPSNEDDIAIAALIPLILH
jgi:hypothetical protein